MNNILRVFLLIFILINFNKSLYGLESHWGLSEVSKVRLISPLSHNDNQTDIILALEYQMEPGWKTYWQSPGDGGFSQELSWSKSDEDNFLKYSVQHAYELKRFHELSKLKDNDSN